MKEYELSVLIHPDLEVDLEAPLEKVRSIITSNGGKVVKEVNDGKKRLAYRIKNQDFAVYVYMDVELPAEALAKVSSTLNITDDVIRYLLVATDHKGRAAQAEATSTPATTTDSSEE